MVVIDVTQVFVQLRDGKDRECIGGRKKGEEEKTGSVERFN
jgi:hypothetical protein